MTITATDWRPLVKNTLRGFVTLTIEPGGIVLKECALHEKEGKRWVGLPAKPQVDRDGQPRKDPATGKALYTSIVEIAGKDARDRFQAAALTAVDKLRGAGSAP
jgi:hypothetical protein